jgi:hypothetical protein
MHDFFLLLIFSSLGCLIGKSIEPWPDVRASDFNPVDSIMDAPAI